MGHLLPSNLGFGACIPVQGITVSISTKLTLLNIKARGVLKNYSYFMLGVGVFGDFRGWITAFGYDLK